MMKIMSMFLCLILLASLAAACQAREETWEQYEVYFPVDGGSFKEAFLDTEQVTIQEEENLVDALLARLLQGPSGEGMRRAVPEGASVRGWTLENGVLTVDFTRSYGSLSGIELTLADYSVTMTLSQIPEVTSVVTMVEGDTITYRDHQNLKPEDVILSIHRDKPVERVVTLWVLAQDGQNVTLKHQEQSIVLEEDEGIALAVLYALIECTESEGIAGLPAKADVISAEVKDDICSLDLSASFYELAPEDEPRNSAVLAALTMSLCDLDTVSAVRFLSEGEPAGRYGKLSLTGELERVVQGTLPGAEVGFSASGGQFTPLTGNE